MNSLDKILEHKRHELAEAMRRTSLQELKDLAEEQEPGRGFLRSLQGAEELALIAEIKSASPSRGAIRPNLDPADVACAYERAGAHALSVLTESRFFHGSPVHLQAARRATSLPVLRKDFLIDPYQVYEAWAWGADAVLLIVAALDGSQLEDLIALASELRLDALVEVHDKAEAETALKAGCKLIGINNRDLRTLETNIETSLSLLPIIAPHAFAVSESGLESRSDLERVQRAGANGVLIGTAFCEASDVGAKVREVMGWT